MMNPVQLIKTQHSYEAALARLLTLMDAEITPGSREDHELELLALAIEAYEWSCGLAFREWRMMNPVHWDLMKTTAREGQSYARARWDMKPQVHQLEYFNFTPREAAILLAGEIVTVDCGDTYSLEAVAPRDYT